MKTKNVITITNVTKEYKVFANPKQRLMHSVLHLKKYAPKIFNATTDLSLTIRKGEILGIIGRNGAGKSTLLKMITGVSFPTTGKIEVEGRISSLLELGAGFNPELNGIENIYFQGDLLGISKEEMSKRVESILEFASIGDFIQQPVKNYSSGMFARLAFATAINVDPDILIVDEVLSVGDIGFQLKCIEKMKEFATQGVTIIFVTHSMMSLYRFCNRAIWIDGGKIIMDGTVEEVVPRYEDNIKINRTNTEEIDTHTEEIIRINKFDLIQGRKSTVNINVHQSFQFGISYTQTIELEDQPYLAISIIKDGMTYDVFGVFPSQERYTLEKEKGTYYIEIDFINPAINIGEYELYFSIHEKNGIGQLYFGKACNFSIVGELNTLGIVDIEHTISITKQDTIVRDVSE